MTNQSVHYYWECCAVIYTNSSWFSFHRFLRTRAWKLKFQSLLHIWSQSEWNCIFLLAWEQSCCAVRICGFRRANISVSLIYCIFRMCIGLWAAGNWECLLILSACFEALDSLSLTNSDIPGKTCWFGLGLGLKSNDRFCQYNVSEFHWCSDLLTQVKIATQSTFFCLFIFRISSSTGCCVKSHDWHKWFGGVTCYVIQWENSCDISVNQTRLFQFSWAANSHIKRVQN